MALVRFGVSIDRELIDRFDKLINKRGYRKRSEAFRDLMRQELVKQEWRDNEEVAGAVTLIYDHHRRELTGTIISIQHDFQQNIISNQHVHIDHDNCLEIMAVKGNPYRLIKLSDMLRAVRGVKHCALSMSSTGKNLK